MAGLIGRKIGMTSMFDENRRNIPVTLIEAGPCPVVQVKTEEEFGYHAVQIAYEEVREKVATKPMIGHYKKAGLAPHRLQKEFHDFKEDYNPGDIVDVNIFNEGQFVDVVGTSKGKGFQGVVKRHGFAGVGGQTHGQHNRGRAPGSLGACSTPSRVFKGMKMGGRMGNERVLVENLRVMKIVPEKNLIVVAGPVPGPIGGYVFVQKEL